MTCCGGGLVTLSSRTRNIIAVNAKTTSADMSDWALPKSHYTHRVVAMAVRLVVEDGLSYHAASWHLWRDHRVFVLYTAIQNWVERGEKGGVTHRRPVTGRRGWMISRGTLRPTSCRTVHSAFFRLWTTAPFAVSSMK